MWFKRHVNTYCIECMLLHLHNLKIHHLEQEANNEQKGNFCGQGKNIQNKKKHKEAVEKFHEMATKRDQQAKKDTRQRRTYQIYIKNFSHEIGQMRQGHLPIVECTWPQKQVPNDRQLSLWRRCWLRHKAAPGKQHQGHEKGNIPAREEHNHIRNDEEVKHYWVQEWLTNSQTNFENKMQR